MKKDVIKNLNGKSGFTLIELLAVIVVLAVVMLIGVNAVLPQVEKARKGAFAIEANGLVEAAKQAYSIDALEHPENLINNTVEYTVTQLREKGQTELGTDYKGKVVITISTNDTTSVDTFTYQVALTNGKYTVQLGADNVQASRVKKAVTGDAAKPEFAA